MDWLLHNPIAEIFGPYSDSTAGRLNLAPSGMSDLCQVAHAEIAALARSLNHKRLGAVKQLLPLTTRALGSRFEAHFLEHAARYPPAGIQKHLHDALAFARFLRERRSPLEPPSLACLGI